jgi:hypothetical protein
MTLAAPVATVGVVACRHRHVTTKGGSIRHSSHKGPDRHLTDEVAVHFMARFVARNEVVLRGVAPLVMAAR